MERPAVDLRVRTTALLLGAIAIIYGLLYAPARQFQYVWDDVTTIQNNPQFDRPLFDALRVTQHGHIDETLTKLRDVAPEHESYRPLLFLTFAAEVKLFGRSPVVMHVTNVVLGLLTALVAFGLASSLLGTRRAGMAVAAIMALHPLVVEPVSYVSARADLLSGLLALGSVALAWRAGESLLSPARVPLIAGSCLLFAGSLFAKEGTVALPLGLAALWLFDRDRRLRGPLIALAAVVPLYFATRALLLSGAPAMAHGGGMLRGALAVPGLALQYLTLFIAPAHLSIVRPMRAEFIALGWVVGGAAVAGIGWAWLRRRQALVGSGVPGGVMGGLGWAVALVGPSAVVAVIMGVAADRYAYLPLFGFALAAVVGVRALWASRPRLRIPMAVVGGTWGVLLVGVTYLAIPAWKDPYALYATAVVAEPDSSAARYGLGVALARLGFWKDSVTVFEKAVALDGANMRAWNNLSVSYETMGRLGEAEHAARRAIALSDGTHFRAYYNLATVLLRRGETAGACKALDRALEINPYYARAEGEAVRSCGRRPRMSENGPGNGR